MRFIIYRQTGGIHSALRSHQGTHRQCASWFFPFVRFGSLAVKPVCSRPMYCVLYQAFAGDAQA